MKLIRKTGKVLFLAAAASMLFASYSYGENSESEEEDQEAAESSSEEEDEEEEDVWEVDESIDYDSCLARAAKEEKPVMILFVGSDWCGWCKKLEKEILSEKDFQDWAEKNIVIYTADFPKERKQSGEIVKKNKALSEKFNVDGFPTVVLVNAKGKEIARTGYKEGGPDAYVKHLESLLSKK